MCFMQKNSFCVKFPLNSKCLNVRMVNFECQSVDLVNFMGVIYTESIGKIVYLQHLLTSLCCFVLSDSLSLSAPHTALSIGVAITVSSLTAFSTTRVSINSDIDIQPFRYWSDYNSQTFRHFNAK